MHHRYKTKTRPVDHWSGPQKLIVKLHWNHLHVNYAIITSLKLLACHIRLFKLFVGIEKDSWDEMILSVVRFNWMVRILEWRTIGINSWYLTTHNTSKFIYLAQLSSKLKWSFLVCLSGRKLFTFYLLQNHWANINQTWHKAFLAEEDSSLIKRRARPFAKGR